MTKPNDPEKQKGNFFSEWLEQMQQESWQLELLISGLALYGILESRDMLSVIDVWVSMNAIDTLRAVGRLSSSFLEMAWTIGAINLFAHIFLRGLWIGAIGLRYVSGDIDYDKLGFSERFTTYFAKRIGSYDDFIERLERVCSMMFAYTFLLFFIFLSYNLFLIPVILPIILIVGNNADPNPAFIGLYGIAAMIYGSLGFIVFIDFVTGGRLKKIKDNSFSKLYLPLYRLFATLTFSFLYRPILYNFLDNKYSRRWFFFSIPYILIIAAVVPNFEIHSHAYFPTNNDDRYTGDYYSACDYMDERIEAAHMSSLGNSGLTCSSLSLALSSFTQEGPYMEFFIPFSTGDDDRIGLSEGLLPLQYKGLVSAFNSSGEGPILDRDENPDVEAMYTVYETEKDSLNELRREARDVHGRHSAQALAIEKELKEARERLQKAKREYSTANMKRVKEAILDSYILTIDGRDILPEVQSFFHIQPYRRTKGLKCIIMIDDLKKGLHEFSFQELEYIKTVSFGSGAETEVTAEKDTETTTIPFLKTTDTEVDRPVRSNGMLEAQ